MKSSSNSRKFTPLWSKNPKDNDSSHVFKPLIKNSRIIKNWKEKNPIPWLRPKEENYRKCRKMSSYVALYFPMTPKSSRWMAKPSKESTTNQNKNPNPRKLPFPQCKALNSKVSFMLWLPDCSISSWNFQQIHVWPLQHPEWMRVFSRHPSMLFLSDQSALYKRKRASYSMY